MLNNIILIGRLVADPELRKTQTSGTSVCSFTLAVQRSYSADNAAEATAEAEGFTFANEDLPWG